VVTTAVVCARFSGVSPGRIIEPSSSRCADDTWLQRWLPLLREHTGERCVLELGCGKGRDTAVLLAAGLRVVAVDRSAAALAEARRAVPGATFIESDLRAPLPIDPADVGAVVASLSLHYFDWQTTRQIVGRLQVCLAPDGPLVCRVNSSRDVHHGATGHPPIEPGYFRVGEETKRFFSHADLLTLFDEGWHIAALEEHTIDRYEHPKLVWELMALVS
jgi:SAM-dependent methyltransferase